MALVKIKEKYQVTLPAALQENAGLEVGDLLEAEVQGKQITLTPKTTLDRELAQALKAIDEGKAHGSGFSIVGQRSSRSLSERPAISTI